MAIDINLTSQVSQSITNGVTDKAPSEDAVFDALALKQDSIGYTAENTSNKSSSYTASSTTTYANTKALVDGLASIRNVYQIITGTLAPADSTTYYSNATADTTANFSTNIAVYQCQIPITGTIKECSIVVFNNNSPTTEASTLYLRNLTTSTDYQLSKTVTFDATNGVWKPLALITGLSIPVVAGSNYNLKLLTPAWGTNPASIRIAVNLSISA